MKKKVLAVVVALCMAFSMALAGCSQQDVSSKTKVRIALCQQAMFDGIPAVLAKKFPDVEFEFVQANNSADYYKYLAENDDLPDILTIRRFSLADATDLKDKLVDVSESDFAATYYQNYLQNFTYEDGTVNWLPGAAEMWCIAANKTLFEKYNIALPTDYSSFVDACKQFQKLGIKGFESDWSYDYTALETLEGFNIETLQSNEGLSWRNAYESGETEGADKAVWSAAFKHLYQVLSDTDNLASSSDESAKLTDMSYSDVDEDFSSGKVAMIRSSGADVSQLNAKSDSSEYILLPYFGETESQNWLLTYPYFQAAMNSSSDVDSALLMEIYTCLLGQECQDALKMGSNALSFTSEVTVEPNEYLENVQTYIDENRVFTRLANNKVFAGALDSVQGMISGKYTADQAYEAFNTALSSTTEEPEKDLNIETGYSYEFTDEHGSQSSSALLNSLREQWGSDLAVSYSTSFSNSVYAGPMASSKLSYYFAANYGTNYQFNATGKQIKSLLSTMLSYEPDDMGMYGGMNPVSRAMLPVTSGFEYTCTENTNDQGVRTYALDSVTVNGEELADDATYNFTFCVPSYYAAWLSELAGVELPDTSSKESGATPVNSLTEYFASHDQLAEPTDYVKVNV